MTFGLISIPARAARTTESMNDVFTMTLLGLLNNCSNMENSCFSNFICQARESISWSYMSSILCRAKDKGPSTIIQCPLDKATLDIAAALPIATSTPVTNLRQYINSDLGYNYLKFSAFSTTLMLRYKGFGQSA